MELRSLVRSDAFVYIVSILIVIVMVGGGGFLGHLLFGQPVAGCFIFGGIPFAVFLYIMSDFEESTMVSAEWSALLRKEAPEISFRVALCVKGIGKLVTFSVSGFHIDSHKAFFFTKEFPTWKLLFRQRSLVKRLVSESLESLSISTRVLSNSTPTEN